MSLKYITSFMTIVVIGLLHACTEKPKEWKIGVSQCSEDIWRYKQNREMVTAAYTYNNVQIELASADDSDSLQISQIQAFIDQHVDLLVVSPNTKATLSSIIEKAYDKGIPVILFDRKTNSDKYTAFMGADNYEVGQTMGKLIGQQMAGTGVLVEITGLKGSSPAMERHRGFSDALKAFPGIKVISSELGDWTEASGEQAMREVLKHYDGPIDCLFGHNDRLAMGARKVALQQGRKDIIYYGVDALPHPGGGLECVQKGIMRATYVYPTQGLELMRLAMNILEGKPYERQNLLHSAVVDKTNADMVMMQSKEQLRSADYLELLHGKIDQYFTQVNNQRRIILFIVAFVVVLLVLAVVVYRSYLIKARLNDELNLLNARLGRRNEELQQLYKQLEDMADSRMVFFTQIGHQLRTPLTLIAGPVETIAKDATLSSSQRKLVEMMERNMSTLTQLVDALVDVRQMDSEPRLLADSAENTEEERIEEPEMSESEEENDKRMVILVVDDNTDMRYLLRSILQPTYRVYLAANGQEGLQQAQAHVPDLVVSDVMMPVMDGLELCRKLKESDVTCHIPVMMLTARVLQKQRVEGYAHGADAYITKPFSAEVLTARIENLLASRKQLKKVFAEGIAKSSQKQIESNSPDNAFVNRLRATILQSMGDADFSVERIGEELGMSRVQLYRKVKALTGLSPVELIRKSRLEQAKTLLLTTHASVSEIAYEVGFTAPSYFAKCFKDEYGKSPGDIRSENASE